MAIQFLNEVWAARLLMDLKNESVYKMLGNQNYTADANNAKQVHLGKVTGDISVSDYQKDTDIADPQTLATSDTVLALSNQKYFNFFVDSIDKAQTKPAFMTEAMRLAAIAIAQTMDTSVSAELAKVGGMPAGNRIVAGIALANTTAQKGENLIKAVTDLKQQMRTQNISKTARPWMVLSPKWIKILEDYLLLEGNSSIFVPGSAEMVLRGGFQGSLLGIDTYWSNQAPAGAGADAGLDTKIIAGTKDTFTFAGNVTETTAYKPEARFGDAVKGLYVYGVKVTNPKQLFHITNA